MVYKSAKRKSKAAGKGKRAEAVTTSVAGAPAIVPQTSPRRAPVSTVTTGPADVREMRSHGRSRGVKVEIRVEATRADGARKEQTLREVYGFDPDPHDNPQYSKDPQGFYGRVGQELAKDVEKRHCLPAPEDGFKVEVGKWWHALVPWGHDVGYGFESRRTLDPEA
ncbi:hypothetical protein ACFVVA_17445 [Kitasatospora sp. NPDC058048]|uniref:hypothetical protein n=1 Tax=Kitasatospora sp. NPDC058048 TaxID=3346313 RepID=UPI0036D93668